MGQEFKDLKVFKIGIRVVPYMVHWIYLLERQCGSLSNLEAHSHVGILVRVDLVQAVL